MLTLGTTGAGIAYAMSGEKKLVAPRPPISAKSKEEEAFIEFVHFSFRHDLCMAQAITKLIDREFLKNNGGEQKAKH